MNKLQPALVFLVATTLSITGFGENVKASRVPAEIKNAFNKVYPSTPARWSMEDGQYEASFKKSGRDMSVLIAKSGNITETETDIPVSQLPPAVTSYVGQHYKAAKMREASKIVKNNGGTSFEALVNGNDLIFDGNGKFIKSIKE